MNTVNKDELYQNLSGFLKSKGIELKDGTYAQRIQQGCNVLAEIVNTTQQTMGTAKAKMDKALDQLRESIHQATAPKPPPPGSPAPEPSTPPPAAEAAADSPPPIVDPVKKPAADSKAPRAPKPRRSRQATAKKATTHRPPSKKSK